MNKKFLALGLLTAVLCTDLMAQSDSSATTAAEATSTSTEAADFYSRLKNGPVHFSLLSGIESMKKKEGEDYNYNGYSTFHLATVSGSITDRDSLSGTVYYRTDSEQNEAGTQEWYRAYVSYNHKWLKQSEVGFDLKTEMYLRYYPTYSRRAKSNNNGMVRPAVSVSRAFDSGLYLSTKLHFAQNIAKSGQSSLEGRSTGYIYLVTSQAYNFTDKLSISFLQEWAHYYNKGDSTQEGGDMIPSLELGYQLHPQVYAGIYTTGLLMQEHDGQLLAQDWSRQLTYGFNMSLTVF